MSTAVVAAIVSASIAGIIALVKTLLDVSGGGRNAARDAHRQLLGTYLADLGRDVPGVVAAANVYRSRVSRGQTIASWQSKVETHANGLKTHRSSLRYLLYGVDEGFRVLSRVAGWIQHFGGHDKEAAELLDKADKLRIQMDFVIAKSYRRGQPPTRRDQRRVRTLAQQVTDVWESRIGVGPASDEGELS